MTEIHDLSAVDLLARYAQSRCRRPSLCRGREAHRRWEPHLKALYAYDPEGARAEAKASKARWAKGAPMGPLDGVPVTVKENIATKGVPCRSAPPRSTLAPAAQRRAPAARGCARPARSSSARPPCPTTACCRPAYRASIRSRATRGTCRRIPAARAPARARRAPPATGRCISAPTSAARSACPPAGAACSASSPASAACRSTRPTSAACAGPMTRTVDDAALMMAVLSSPDQRDGMSLPPRTSTGGPFGAIVQGLRIGLMLDAGWRPAGRGRGAARRSRRRRRRSTRPGAIVEPVAPLMTRAMLDGLDDFFRARSWADIEPMPAEQRAKILPYIANGPRAAQSSPAPTRCAASTRRCEMRRLAARLFGNFDYLLSPTAPIPAFAAELRLAGDDPERPFEHICFTVPWNISPSSRPCRSTAASRRPACRSACRSSAAASTTTAC